MTVEKAPSTISFENFIFLVLNRKYDSIKEVLSSNNFDINSEDFRGVTALHYVAELDDLELVKLFSKQPKSRINVKTLDMMLTPLMIAAGNGNLNVMKFLLSKGADISAQNATGHTSLMLAAQGHHISCVNALIEQENCNPLAQNIIGKNALMLAIDNPEIVNKLLPISDLSQVDSSGSTALHLACEKGSEEVINILINISEIPINLKNNEGETPLHIAVKNIRLDLAEKLLQNGASLFEKDENGHNIFQFAAIYDESNEFLIKRKHELDDETFILAATYGRLPVLNIFLENYNEDKEIIIGEAIISAAKSGNLDCLKLLVAVYSKNELYLVNAGVAALEKNHFDCFEYIYNTFLDISTEDELTSGYRTIIITAAFSSGCVEACKLFLEQGIDPNGSDSTTYLMVASGNGNKDVVELLISHGADINSALINWGSALILATINSHFNIVKILLENGADFTIADNAGFTALLSAAYYGYADIFIEIFKWDKNLNQKSNDGLTLLLAASLSGNVYIIKTLFESGSDDQVTDDEGNNCFHCACQEAKGLNSLIFLIESVSNWEFLINSPNINGKTPLDLLILNENQGILYSLIATKSVMKDNFIFPLNVSIETNDYDMCLICRDDFVCEEMATKLPCGHLFHEHCYEEWSVTKPNCPYCQKFPFKVKK